MKKLLVVLCMVVAALSIPYISTAAESTAAISSSPICYMRIDTIPDDVPSGPSRVGGIEGFRVSYGVSLAMSTAPTAGGAGTGRPQQEAFTITKMVSASTPKLFNAMLTGQRLRGATISFIRTGVPSGAEIYYELKFTDIRISGIHQFSEGPRLFEDVTILANRVEMSYNKTTPQGTPGQRITSGFDFLTNRPGP